MRLRRRIENVLDWAKLRGYRNGENPARWLGHLDHTLPAPTKKQKVGHHTAPPFDFLAAVAEHKAKIISKRIKAGLAAAKARGVKLGGNRGVVLTDAARYAGSKALKARANAPVAAPTLPPARQAWEYLGEILRMDRQGDGRSRMVIKLYFVMQPADSPHFITL